MSGRRVVQPGPALEPRVVAVDCRGIEASFVVEPGERLLDGIARGVAAAGATSAVVELSGGAFDPLTFVIPALSTTPRHAAFYSDYRRPASACPLIEARMTFGRKDGEPWFHCHGFWHVEGVITGGHIIPQETIVAEPIRATALCLSGAEFVAEVDPETNFQLFGPVAADPKPRFGGEPVVALRIRPNEDVTATFEALCAAQGWSAARIRGGVASTHGARFVDGGGTENFATEVFVTAGQVAADVNGRPVAAIDVGLIDYTGQLASGRYVRGDNPVLMTFEAVVQRTGGE